ncbi:hypothetical protein NCC49_001632 [Naganishia albida]|nr:hypothetical protein NCC49_001632 [Naganishia albida]
MTSTTDKTYILVTGANRGIGYDLVLTLLKRYPEAILWASAREPASADALNQLANKDSRVHVVKLITDDEESNKKAVEEIKKVTNRLDIVVANAGINSPFVPVHEETTEYYKTNFNVNTLGPLYLYQATYPLLIATRLQEASKTDGTLPIPKFFITSSMVGSTGGVPAQFVNGSYGASKAAANHIASAIHHQTEKAGAVVIPYHPGLVVTDMARKTASEFGLTPDQMPGSISPEQCAEEYAELIVKATRDEHGGKFWGQGFAEPIPW